MISAKIEGLPDLLKKLKALPPELVSNRGGPVRSSLRKAAVVIQKQAKANIDRMVTEGETNESTGLLSKSIIVSRKKPGSFKGERYWVRIKRSARNREGVSANKYGGVLEFGEERIPAKAWFRRAWESTRAQALTTFIDDLEKGIKRIEKKLARLR